MNYIGIIVNMAKDKNLHITGSIVNWIENKGGNPLLTREVSSKLDRPMYGTSKEEIYRNSDFIIVLGGDGTILGTARESAMYEPPILGVNLGHLGFLAEAEVKDVFDSLEATLNNGFKIEKRMMLESIINKGGVSDTFHALNDVVITRGTLSRIITMNVYINNDYVTTIKGDGLIIATPTGSTAYSLSAGGPIVSPNLSVISITPICPHSITNRSSLVISEDEVVRINLTGSFGEAYLTADGQEGCKIDTGHDILIRKAPFKANLIKLFNRSFFDVLKDKLSEN